MNFIIILFLFFLLLPMGQLIADDKEPSLPIILKSDKVDGDQNNDIVNVIGNVELRKGNNIIFADKMSYDKNSNFVKAYGNVRVLNYELGNIFANYADIKDDITVGHFEDATIVFNNGSYIESPRITRVNKAQTVLEDAIFSICPNPAIAKDNQQAGQSPDLFSIKSRKTTINKEKESITINSAVVKMGNFPVLYTPFMLFPLPSSKRKSGFLQPYYVSSNKLNKGIVVPYYFNIAPNKDLTSTAHIYPEYGHILLNNNYRHLLKEGVYQINLEFANNKIENKIDSTGDTTQENDNLRWHFTSAGEFVLSENIGLEFNIDNVGDKDYTEDYHNFFLNNTISKVNVDYIKDRNYYSITTARIQEIENEDDKNAAPFALPIINSYMESKPGSFNQRYSLLGNSTVITRRDGLQYRRASLKPQIKVPYNIAGNLFEFGASLRSDFYNLENNFEVAADNNFDDNIFNYRPSAKLNWNLPLVKKIESGSIIIDPMVNVVYSSYSKNFNSIPNEDSQNIELTYNNMFLDDRFVGFDRNESGVRVNYGLKSALYNYLGTFVLGISQGYKEGNQVQDVSIEGFNSDKSNIVGQFSYNANKIFSIGYNFQLNESDYNSEVNSLNVGLNFDRVQIGSNYIFTKESASNSTEREQASFNSAIKLTDKFFGKINIIRDLAKEKAILQEYSLIYDGCCVTYGIHVTKSNPSDFIKAETSYRVQFVIKNL